MVRSNKTKKNTTNERTNRVLKNNSNLIAQRRRNVFMMVARQNPIFDMFVGGIVNGKVSQKC